jgi:hypothetical protein
MELKLTGEERDMLMSLSDVPVEVVASLKQARSVGDHWQLSLSEHDADDLRDRCGERWQEIGWAGDEVTASGRILDNLIDKLYTG